MITAYDLHKNLILPSDGIRMKEFFEDYPLIEEQGTSLIIPEVNLLKRAEKLQLFLVDVPILYPLTHFSLVSHFYNPENGLISENQKFSDNFRYKMENLVRNGKTNSLTQNRLLLKS